MVDTGFWVAPQNIHRFVGKWMPIDAKMNMSAPPSLKGRKGLRDISSLDGGAAPGGNIAHIETIQVSDDSVAGAD